MESTTRKKDLPDQMNIRLGSNYIAKFNEYMKNRDGKKIDFIRDALDYWMQVDGDAENILNKLDQAQQTISMLEERVSDLQSSRDKQVEVYEKLLAEKDKRISLLTSQLNQSQDPHYIRSVRESVISVGESKPKYQKEKGKK
ncbi:hypothetical protein [Methanorbis rubei]|uniref:Uncharacterized protein n=1 Tax=Methanorbis rubei TaxID=3028300 RepID=A0AAE4SBH5_9EURY|nr:hypothetical protein [Methanocorpusculaceae archaeon Cs1]